MDESQDLDEEPGEPSEALNLFKDFESDSTDGKIDVIIGFTGAPAQGAQHQERMNQRTELIEGFGGEVERGFTIINAVNARLPMQAIETLSKRHEVSYIEPNYKISLISQNVPWGIDRAFGPEKYTFTTWSTSRGKGVAVAVLDTGIDENHIDLPTLLGGVNTVDSTHWGSDVYGHGTHVAGTIAALDNSTGVVGAAPAAGIYSVKVLDDSGWGTYSSVIAGIEWALNKNIPVMNMSLGGGSHTKSLKDAVDAAYAGGVLLVAAAGNDGNSSDNVLYPARYDSVIAVSASDSNNKMASFSSRGPSIELIAPGVSIQSTYPGNYYATWSGTSMATPHVAGSAATLWAADTSLSNVEVRQLLRQTAQNLGLPADHQGYGLVRPDVAVVEIINSTVDATLSALTVNEGILGPSFTPDITEYKVDAAHDIDSVDVTATISDENASLTISDEDATSGESKSITLNPAGTLTEIDIVVTAEDGATEKKYTLTVNRKIKQTFTDVLTDHPFFEEIEALAAAGISEGWEVENGKEFRPFENVTRQAMAAFLVRALELKIPKVTEPSFSDVSSDHPFFTEIEALAKSGISVGYIDGTFKPSANVTRQAMAAFLVRGLEYKYNNSN